MPTKNPRVNIVVEPPLYSVMRQQFSVKQMKGRKIAYEWIFRYGIIFRQRKAGKLARVEAILGDRSLGLSDKELCYAENWRKTPFRFGHRIKKQEEKIECCARQFMEPSAYADNRYSRADGNNP